MEPAKSIPALDEKKRRLLALLARERGIDPLRAPILPLPRDGRPFPLSFAQERLWVIDQLEPGNIAYNVPTALRLSGALRPSLLAAVLGEVVRRHETLRTTFGVGSDGRPVQIVHPPVPEIPLADLSGLPAEAREAEARRLAREEAGRAFDLALGPVLRIQLLRLAPGEHALLFTVHHIASDGWSNGVLVGEVARLYEAFSRGLPSPLPGLGIQYADYAAWQREAFQGEVLERDLAYWRRQLAGTPVLELPADRPRPAVQGLAGGAVTLGLPAALAEGSKALARQEGATLFMVVTAAFQTLLSRLSGQEDLSVGTPVANRHRTETEGLIGFFVNTLVLRTDLSGDPPFRELLARVRKVAIGAFEHGELPFSKVVEEIKPERSLSHTPLFQVMCALGNAPGTALEIPGLRFSPLERPVEAAMFDLNLSAAEHPGGLETMLEYRADLFDRTTAQRLLGAFAILASAAVADPGRRLSDLPLLSPPERQALLVEWSDTAAADAGGSLEEALAASAARHGDRVALVFGGESLTYREASARANRLAWRLRELGIGPGSRVGLCAGRSLEAILGLLAVLKAGAAYVPLDPAYPAERLAFMLADSGASALLTQERLAASLPPFRGRVILLESPDGEEAAPPPSASPGDLGYVIYTSGSTGRPKGVAMTRAALANMLAWQEREAVHGPARTLQFASLSFDVSFQEIASTWLAGGTLVLVSEETRRDPFALLRLLDEQRIERSYLPFVALRQLAEAAASAGGGETLRDVITAGEQLQVTRAVAGWLARTGARLHNHYGPSESHVVTALVLTGDPGSWPALPPVGRPIANTRIVLLDAALQPVPAGVPAELCIGGTALARGYLDRPDLTAERFVPDPFAAGERLYRTGDLARRRVDGTIEFLGRRDGQVKIRGVRVEPGEVETALDAHPGVRQAVVVPRAEPGSPGTLRLVAFFLPVPGAAPSSGELRDFIAARLPAAVVPSLFVPLEGFPTTPSGKVDRRALATLGDLEEGRPGVGDGFVPPRTQAEELMAGIWASLLGTGRVGADDNFFELGGHSLLATQVVSRVREVFRVEIPQRALFEAPTVAGLARAVEAAAEGLGAALLPRIERAPETGRFPLSFAQERLWLVDQIDPGSASYNLPAALRFAGGLHPGLLTAIFGEIVRRHAVLRTTFAAANGDPVQIVHPPAPFPLPVVDLEGLPGDRVEGEARRLAAVEALRPFDLLWGPVLRAAVLRLGPADHVLLFTMHHIASDGWSTGILVREVMALYDAASHGRPSPLPELPLQYADFARWQRRVLGEETLAALLGERRERLAGVPPLELPTDRPRPPVERPEGAAEPVEVPAGVAAALKSLARREGATLFMALAAVWQALLSRTAGQEGFALGTPVAGRNRTELEGLIGFFVNTVVLRADLAGAPSFRELLARVRGESLAAFARQDLPFERLVEALSPERSLARSPLFQVMLVLQNAPASALEIPGLAAIPFDAGVAAAKFDLTLSLGEAGDGFGGGLEYRTGLFDPPTIRRLLARFGTLLAAMVEEPGRPLSELPWMPEAERRQVLSEWSRSEEVFPEEAPLQELFARQVERTPEAVAVTDGGESLTYRELDRRAGRLALRLRNLGVGPEVPVGLFLERSVERIVATVAVVRTGGAYVPLDPSHPRERLAFLLADTAAPVIVTEEALRGSLPESAARVLLLEERDGEGNEDLDGGAPADGLLYVMYTSGSTGTPKGVAVVHRGVARLARWARGMGIGPGDTVLQLAPYAFDASTLEVWGALLTGARVAVPPPGTLSLEEIGEEVDRHGATVLWLTAGLFHAMAEGPLARLGSLRLLLAGGDVLSVPHVRRALRELPGTTLVNGYGPTENTTFTCCHPMAWAEELTTSVPVGRPISGTRVLILDPAGRPVPVGVPGELCTGGDGLARGYLNRPDLTAAAFVPDPYGDPGERLYRTGDLARFLPDGRVEVLGRLDRQVKIRGFRVEPGEVEAVLAGHPEVREGAVVVGEDAAGKRLVAFVVPRAPGAPPAPEELRAWLAARLPEPLVPAAFALLDALPLTPNGKVDRRALARISPEPARSGEIEPPRSATEAALARLWAAVLGVDRVGIRDDFFALGGHSLLATRLVSRVREELGVELPVRALFEAPTVAALAPRLETAGEGRVLPPVTAAPREGLLPLSFAQERLWLLDQLTPGGTAYNVPAGLRVVGALRPDVLARAFGEIARRHESLRTTFAVPTAGGEPVQVIAPPAPVPLPLVDLAGLPSAEREAELRRLADDEGGRPFDLTRGPVWRAALARLGVDDHALFVTLHHIASDGWSLGVLVAEIVALYGAFSRGLPSPLPALPVQSADYAVWQRRLFGGGAMEASLAWWRRQLADLPVLELPTDRPRSAAPSDAASREELSLPPDLAAAVTALARRHGATLFMVLTAAFQAFLSRYSGQTDVAVGTPVAGRLRAELEDLIGFFVNTLVLRAGLVGDPAFGDCLDRTRDAALAAFAHQQVPFERLVEEINPERSLSHSPLFQVMIVLQNAPAAEADVPGVSFRPLETGAIGAKFDLTLTLAETGDGLAGTLEYRTALFDAATARRMLDGFATLLAGAATDPGLRLSELPLLTPAEREELAAWSGPRAAFESTLCLHERFALEAARTPEAVAVVCEGEGLTFGELHARANRLARRLRRRGVGPEARVALAAGRSLEMIVGILGILAAGGAYVPLDPSSPEERLRYILEDSAASVLLTSEHLTDPSLAEESGEALPSLTDPDNAAYVIYTSGSTGAPKGTVVTHRNVTRLFDATDGWFGFAADDVWTLFHSFAFDFSVWEIWGALLYGGRLVVVPHWVSRDPQAFLALLERERVTVLNQTPSAFRQLIQADAGEAELSLRWVIFGGEALDLVSLAPWFDRHGDERPRLVNMYGITETTVHVSYRPITRADLAEPWRSPIGVPIPDLSIHLLDPHGNLVPVGVPGEICVGGAGLARGYLGRPGLTAERYGPGSDSPRLYRSGDLGRWRPGGEIDYLGRIDHQVKIRGFRIEPGEIEAALVRHPAVREAVVLLREEAGDRRLMAYLGTGDREAPADLRGFLAGALPDYMIPSAFVALPALPLTAHGKVDRRALAEIRPEGGGGEGFVPPRTATEEVLAGLWAAVLGVERVGVRDDFFALGGHSLLATQLVSRIRAAFGVEIPLRALFEGPTVEALARRIETSGRGEAGPPIVPVPRDGGPLPLSFAQERLWFLDQFEPGTPTLNMPASLRLRDPLDVPALSRALDETVRRHESLRTTFGSAEGTPFQRIAPPFSLPLPVIDLRHLDEDLALGEAGRLEAEEYRRPFDLTRGPLLHARLVRHGEEGWTLLLTLHHIVSDGWSMGLLRRELGALYRAFTAGRPSPLPGLALQYADYAVWQRGWLAGETLERQIVYWREKLAGVPALDLPTDRPRPAVQTWRGASFVHTLEPDLAGRLAGLARREGATLFMVLLAGLEILLSRLAGQEDFAVGAPIAGRGRAETEGLIGCFLNNLALRADLAGNPTVRELLARVRATALEAYAHQDVPFEKLLEELNPERDLSRTPLFQVFLNMLNFPVEEGALAGGDGDGFTPDVPAKFDLTVYAAEAAGEVRLDLVYNADLFDRERVAALAGQLETLLAQAAADSGVRIASLSLLTPAARAVLPEPSLPLGEGWQGAVHEALARRAAESPERIAVADGRDVWTYGDLDAASNRLARILRAQGIDKGDVAAVWAHRNASLPWAVLGTLKAGAAFLILDPAYPAARLADYVRAGRPRAWIVVAGAGSPPAEVEEALAAAGCSCRVELPGSFADLPADDPGVEIGPDDAAVLTFTSGSTGRPKAVVGRHGPLTWFYPWMSERFGLSGEDRFGMLSALSHDPLQRDLFTPLWLGATLCVPDPERIGSPGYLADWVRREGVTVLHLTPAMLELLVSGEGEMPSLRRVFVVGDLLKRSDVARLQRLAPRLSCVNLYGSTETQRSVAFFEVPRPEDPAAARLGREVLPLGRGMEDVQLLILDGEGRLAGIGELGEIHLRSAHLALGYLDDPALTAERFLPDPFVPGIRLYRTGDLGRYRPDGAAEFAGRADAQIKIRGFRIEPGEIEAAISRFPGVQESVVIVREDRPGDRRLVAYATPAEIDPAGLRSFLAGRLPAYMVPVDVVPLPALPLTRTAKVDRRALPAPERAAEAAALPRTPVEERLAEIWRGLLGVVSVGVHDDFFDLGGHSLLATQLLSRLRSAFGVELPLRALFERPTIAGIAGLLAERGSGEAGLSSLVPTSMDEAPLSFAQERLWFLHQLDPAGSAYNMHQALRLDGDLDEEILQAALRELVRRQDALRTRFEARGPQVVQVLSPVPPRVSAVVDLSALPAPAREREEERVVREEALRPYDLRRGPLLRVRLLRRGPGERTLLLALHHIVADGWSMGVLIREVAELYGAFSRGLPAPLPELPLRYADYAAWQRRTLDGERLAISLGFWRRQLAGVPVLELPTDRPRPAVQGAGGAGVAAELPEDLVRDLRTLGRSGGATLFMVLAAGWAAVLSRWSGQTDLAVGTPVAGRLRAELEPLVGLFVNTLVLREDLRGDPSFREILDRTRSVSLAAFAHQEVPFERVVEELSPERSLSHTPLFQVMLVLQNAPMPAVEAPGLSLRPVGTGSVNAKFDLTLTAVELGPDGPLALSLEHRTGIFTATTARRLLGHLETLLTAAAADPALRLSGLPLLTAAEIAEIAAWSGPRETFPVSACLHERFAAQAARTPDAVAVVCDGEALTYGELSSRANRLARGLRRLGVGPESRVALTAERSLETVVGILGILAAGGAYVPIDPSYPEERLRYILEDSQASVLLTREDLADPSVAGESSEDLPSLTGPDNAAYVIYTSGSTGRPKGTVVTHANVVRLFAATDAGFGFGPHDVWTLFHSFAFDFSVWEMWGALTYGGRLVVVPFWVSRDPEAFLELLEREEVTVLNQTPSAFRQLVQAEEERGGEGDLALRLIIFGGEALDLPSLTPWIARHGDERPRLVNMYGITETTVHVTWRPITRADLAEPWRSPIGVPIPDLSIYLLDPYGNPVPVGVPGEIHVGGPGLARGYLGRPELTAERFVPGRKDPPRLYRSGDLARWRPGGELDFLGRIDHQVKIRGFRIELGEIEAALAQHPAVREAVVLLREEAGDRRLVAYLAAGDPAPSAGELRAFLAGRLPDPMIPAAFAVLPSLPLTAHGKVDRRALAEVRPEGGGEAEYIAPRTPAEEILAGLWATVLGVERVGVRDDFFALGGHSLLATQLTSRIRAAFGVEVPLRALFERPTVEGVASLLPELRREDQPAPAPPLVALARTEDPPLSFAQQRLWFLHQLDPQSPAYNMHQVLRLEGDLNEAALAAALRELVRRQEALRTRFATRGTRTVQVISPVPDVVAPVVDLTALPAGFREGEGERIAREESLRPFDLQRGPLLRVRLLRLSSRERLLAAAMHHIVSDGWSMGVFAGEVAELYSAFAAGLPSPLPELPVQYADFARWQREWLSGETLRREVAWWRERLAGAPPVLDLPLDRPRPALHTFHGGRRARRLPSAESRALLGLSRSREATPFMVGLALFQALTFRHTGSEDLVVGTPIANRNRQEIEGLIGFFANTLALRAVLRPDLGFVDLLDRVRETALGAYSHQDVPFERLVEELAHERSLRHAPLFQVMFLMAPAAPEVMEAGGLRLSTLKVESEAVKFDLVLSIQEGSEGLGLTAGFNTDLFDPTTVDRLLAHCAVLLQGVAADPLRPLAELPLLTEPERQQILLEWNATASPAPDLLLHEIFAARAVERPDAMAVVDETGTVTYGDLEARANRLARHLSRLGAGPEVRVGLCVERSVALPVGVLAVLKAGAAWVPLDPAWPAERLSLILEDAGISLLVTEELLDGAGESDAPLASAAGAGHLAYVIYTSGSTGRPKGVAVTHRGLANLAAAQAAAFGLGPEDHVLQFASPSFDASVSEMAMTWWAGAALHLAGRDVLLPGAPLRDLLRERRITCATLPPTALAVLPADPLPDLAALIVAGEACPPDLAERWAAGRRFYNAYGPTESTVCATLGRLEEGGRLTLGRPMANVQVHLLDRAFQPVPVGVPGEICVAGPGLARGYLHRPDLTAERFVPDLWSGEPGARLYRTGDLGRYLPDGTIEFLGRIDHQVKVRGVRVELGEVEAALRRHPAVREAVAAVRPAAGGVDLVAWVVAEPRPAISELRQLLGRTLPESMIPAAFVFLDTLPLTPAGKIDRRALPAPGRERPELEGIFVPPATPAEHFLAGVWREVLGIERIGIHDDFFELGGDSVKAAILTNLLEERLGEYVYVVALFDAPTLGRLARYLEDNYPEALARVTGASAAGPAASPENRVGESELARFRALIEPLPPPGPLQAPKNPRAVFILSPPRSGSTLLRVMLAGNPALFAPPELELLGFETLRERQAAFSGRYAFWAEGTVRALMEVEGCGPERAQEIMEELEEKDLAPRDLYGYLQDRIGARTLVDKTPSYALDRNILARAEADFAEPLYIHLLRHPYGMIRSFEKARLEQVFFRREHSFPRRELAELIWIESQRNILDFLAGIPPDRQIRLRFEDLVGDPRGSMERLCGFLGIPFHPAMLDPYEDTGHRMTDGIHALSKMLGDVKFHEHKAVDADVADRWKEEIEGDFLGDLTWDLASDLGYPRPERAPRFSPLVLLAPGGPGRPFFCVHPAGGTAFCYAGLARALAPDRPVYGLQSLGLGDCEPQETIEEMAAAYLREILAVQPEGPWLLGGWSLGGPIAYEMARQLTAQGREVGRLVLIDATAPGWLPEGERLEDLDVGDADFVLGKLAADLEPTRAEALHAEAEKLQGLGPEERLQGVVEAARRTGVLPEGIGLDQVRRLIRLYRTNVAAWESYAPASSAVPTLLLRATEGPAQRNPTLGWKDLLTGDWEIVDVEGTHQTILVEPGFSQVVRVLRDRLGA